MDPAIESTEPVAFVTCMLMVDMKRYASEKLVDTINRKRKIRPKNNVVPVIIQSAVKG